MFYFMIKTHFTHTKDHTQSPKQRDNGQLNRQPEENKTTTTNMQKHKKPEINLQLKNMRHFYFIDLYHLNR